MGGDQEKASCVIFSKVTKKRLPVSFSLGAPLPCLPPLRSQFNILTPRPESPKSVRLYNIAIVYICVPSCVVYILCCVVHVHFGLCCTCTFWLVLYMYILAYVVHVHFCFVGPVQKCFATRAFPIPPSDTWMTVPASVAPPLVSWRIPAIPVSCLPPVKCAAAIVAMKHPFTV